MDNVVTRLETLKKNIDAAKSLRIELSARAKKEEELFIEKVNEIKAMGFDPKTLKDDLVKMEKDIEEKLSAKEKEIVIIKSKLDEIEKNVKALS